MINLSDYKRSGVFIDEINNSTVNTPPAQVAIVNFIPGFSRKGTVFNRPVLINTVADRNNYFGSIDRFLEKKGSYFHRTIEIAIQTAPVWALNVLSTNSLDQLNYASVSVSAQYDNAPIATSQYDTFFNKAGFWNRDTESFLFFASNSQRMVHFTNVSDKKLTLFMFKSPVTGYDVTAQSWYANLPNTEMPSWLNPTDLISDYMVRLVVVSGDWSNYVNLAANPTYAKYFASSGLRDSQVDNFIRDVNVVKLADYTASLIPYFRDSSNNQIFIESLVNLDTDVTGLFCAYDLNNVETDFPNGNVDIIGQTLVGNERASVNFMSYQDTIQEVDNYAATPLDSLGNVIGIGSISGRTALNTNGDLSGMGATLGGSFATVASPAITITGGTAIINSTALTVASGAQTFATIATPATNTSYRIDTLYVDTTGLVKVSVGTAVTLANGLSESAAVTAGLTYPASMASNAIILGYGFRSAKAPGTGATFTLTQGSGIITVAAVATGGTGYAPSMTYTLTVTGGGTGANITATTNSSGVFVSAAIVAGGTGYTAPVGTFTEAVIYSNAYVPVALATGSNSYVPLAIGSAGADITVATTANNVLNLTFNGTATATRGNYAAWRRVLFFNEIVTKKVLSNSTIIDTAGAKVDLSTAVWTDNYTAGSGDKTISLTVGTGSNINTQSYTNGSLVFYYNDNEFVMNTAGLETRATVAGTTNYGIAAKESAFYTDFYNGRINTGDFFYVKAAQTTSLTFVHYTDLAYPAAVGNYIIMSNADASALGLGVGSNSYHLLIQTHPVNAGDYVIGAGEDSTGSGFAVGLVAGGFLTSGFVAFAVTSLVSTYLTPINLDIYNYDLKVYLKMYFAGANLSVQFMADNTLITPYAIPGGLLSINGSISVYSGEGSYEQTLEIAQNSAYTITDTKFLIDLVRYPEVVVGNYVKAYVDSSLLAPGQFPKNFARILKKTPWSGNVTYGVQYAEITTDIKVDIMSFGGDLQTTRYTQIEDYISTYKAITLGGFTVQATATPDGTESRQSAILDVIGTGTNLFNAIVNKNKFNFRYLIDSFGNGLTEFSKQQLVDITGTRKNCMGFINMPSARAFKHSTSPSFINADGTLSTAFIMEGGDPSSNPAFLYSFAQGEGATDGRPTVGYFFPYVTVNDNGRPLEFPPAAYCANTYMRKLNSSIAGIYNWTIAAGTTNGLILGISDVEMDFTNDDLVNFYAMGANPLMYSKNIGFYIETEWTALVSPLSSLSFMHCREILIDLENQLYAMLLKYQWQFNTPAVRAKIKREADTICQSYVDRSALTAYSNVVDETNNTPTVIDNQFGILDTYVVLVKGLATIVNTINVLATGALGTSTGFTA